MYELLLLIHILAGITWFGGEVFSFALFLRARQEGGQPGADQMVEKVSWVEDHILAAAFLVVAATGITMVAMSEAWSFSQLWVFSALGLLALYLGVGVTVGFPLLQRMKEAREQGAVTGPEYGRYLGQYLRLSNLLLALLLAVVVLMVFKPGG